MENSLFFIFIIGVIFLFAKFIDGHAEGVSGFSVSRNVLLIGLPNSGKTVFFSVGMDMLQRIFNELPRGHAVIFEDAQTDQTVRETIAEVLRRQKWPAITLGHKEHRVAIKCGDKSLNLTYTDYSGEAFLGAFNPEKAPGAFGEEEENQFPGVIEAEDVKNQLREDIKKSGDILLVIDASMILDAVHRELSVCLFNLLRFIEEFSFSGRLAMVVTKGDLARGIENFSVEQAFKEQQPNSFAFLRERENFRIFLVSAVNCEIDSEGNHVPPKGYSSVRNSTDMLDPFSWLLGLSEEETAKIEEVARKLCDVG